MKFTIIGQYGPKFSHKSNGLANQELRYFLNLIRLKDEILQQERKTLFRFRNV